MRVRIATALGVVAHEGRTLKMAFAMRCLADSGEKVGSFVWFELGRRLTF